jgi:hypothetical protein
MMSRWDEFDGGRQANANTQRLIDASKAEDHRRFVKAVALVLVILALLGLFTFFDVRIPT